jgi:amino acid adenylation domain-containing protein
MVLSQGVHTMVRRWVTRQPDAPALRDPSSDTTLSYAELWQRSGWVAAELVRRGIGAGDVVAVGLGRSIELVVAMLGIIRAGAAYLPLDAHAPDDRIATILTEAKAGLAISDRPVVGVNTITVPRESVEAAPDSPAGGDAPCYVMYTSGSTGTAKGVLVPHRAVVRLVARPHYCVVVPGDRCANGSNPAFDATTFEIWAPLAAGGTVVVFPSVLELTMDDWTALLRAERIDTMFLTTSLFHTVARERPGAFGTLANLVVGGEQLELAAVRKVLEAGPPRRLINGYGPTETTTFAAYFDCTPGNLAGLDRIPVGFPLQDTALHVLDEDLSPVPPGETGELCIGGPGVALGYLGRADLTAQRFVTDTATGDRLYRTGDLARQLPSGAVELLGRADRQVKLRGFRIELEEIEQAAMATNLCDAVFVEKVAEGTSAYLVGFVLPARDAEDVERALVASLNRRLPDYMIPTRWVVLDTLPFGPTGKVDRAALPALLEESTVDELDERVGAVGELLRQIWREVLNVPRVAPGSNFLDLGGNSVMAVQVATRIQQRLDVAIEPAEILLADSLSELALRLDTTGALP